MYELEELNPSVSEATVYKHIQKLIDAGIVKEVALDDDQRRQGYPWKFYGLTEEGRTFLDEHNLSPRRKPSNRSTRPSLTSPRRWSSTRIPLARTTRNPYRISFVSVLDHRSILYSPASFWNPTTREAGRPRPRLASRGTGAARRSHLRVHTSPPASRSFVDADVAE